MSTYLDRQDAKNAAKRSSRDMREVKPHWSVERNLADDGWIRLVATDKGTCAAACDRYGNIIER
jgi:hypothetical protein